MKKEEHKKNGSNKLLLLIFLLILTLGIGTVGTYAWFTSNKVVDVTNLDVKVHAVNGLEISVDGENWVTRLNKEDLVKVAYPGNTNQIPDILGAVSTAGGVSDGKLNMYQGQVAIKCEDGSVNCPNPEYSLTTVQPSEKKCFDSLGTEMNNGRDNCNGHTYMAFDIYLKVDNDAELLLTNNANVVSKVINNDKGIKNTTRVGFLVQGAVPYKQYTTKVVTPEQDLDHNGQWDEGEEGTDPIAYLQALNGGTDDSLIIWEPNYNAHTPSAIAAAKKFYGQDITADTSRLDYEGVQKNITGTGETGDPEVVKLTETNSHRWPAYFKQVVPKIQTPVETTGADTTLELKSGVTKIRVYFWVEGQDVDAENNATGSDMALNLEFTI